jgi:hypothetical protein
MEDVINNRPLLCKRIYPVMCANVLAQGRGWLLRFTLVIDWLPTLIT